MVRPWCGQMRDSVTKLDVPVRTIATGVPLSESVAMPPTLASAG